MKFYRITSKLAVFKKFLTFSFNTLSRTNLNLYCFDDDSAKVCKETADILGDKSILVEDWYHLSENELPTTIQKKKRNGVLNV